MKKRMYEAKNIDEAKEIALNIFKVPEDLIDIKVVKEKKGILGIGASITVEATLNVDPFTVGSEYIKSILDKMEIKGNVETIKSANEVHYNIYSDSNPILIGKDGKTLHALQYLIRNVVSKYSDDRLIIQLDVGNYKKNRKMQLEILATKTAKEVAFSGVEVKLNKMNSFERRIIHTKLSEWRDIYTESRGEEPNRYIVIKPKNKKN